MPRRKPEQQKGWRELGKRPTVICRNCPPGAVCSEIWHKIAGTAPKCVKHPECSGWSPDDRPPVPTVSPVRSFHERDDE